MKAYTGLPATLGSAAAAAVRVIVWCNACRHRIEADVAAMAETYGAATPVRDWVSRLVLAMRRPRHQLCSHRRQALIAMALPRIQPIIPTRLAAATSMRAIRRARISSPAQRARLPSRKQASTNRTPRRRILPTTASTRPGGARRMIVTESGKSRRWVVKTNQMKYYCTERLAIAECTGVARGSRLWRKLELRRSHFAAVPRFCLLNVFG